MTKILPADLTSSLHCKAIVSLLDAYSRDPMGGGQPLSEYTRMHLISQLQQRDNAVVLLAFVEEEAAGLLTAFEGFSTFQCRPLLNIHDIAVLPAYRGQGIAAGLLDQVQAIGHGRGCCKLTLEVLDGNVAAQSVYRRFGFSGYELDPQQGRAQFWEKKLV